MKYEVVSAGYPYLFKYRPDTKYTLDETKNNIVLRFFIQFYNIRHNDV